MKFLSLLFSFIVFWSVAQQQKLASLPSELTEISGLEHLNDSLLIAINDGGNSPTLYLIDLQGNLVKSIHVSNASNVDWEDLALDSEGQHLYIADVGNNLNQRRDLCFYKIDAHQLLISDSIPAERIAFSYSDQQLFPPQKNNLLFDCEATVFYNGQLYLFGKANDQPYTGTCTVYRLDPSGGVAEKVTRFCPGKNGYFQNSITAADFFQGRFYLSSYSYIYVYTLKNGSFELNHTERFNRLTQKESLVVIDQNLLVVADEKSPLFIGQNLYKIRLNDD